MISGDIQRKEPGFRVIMACSSSLKLWRVLSSDVYFPSFYFTGKSIPIITMLASLLCFFCITVSQWERTWNGAGMRAAYEKTTPFLPFPAANLNEDPERRGDRGAAQNRLWEKESEMGRVVTRSRLGWKWKDLEDLSFSLLSFSVIFWIQELLWGKCVCFPVMV